MSNLSVNTITDASGGSTASINGLTPQASNMQPFNRIINGAMTIDQRNAGAAVTPLTNTYVIDRWAVTMGQASKFTTQISSTAPTGFSNSLLCTTTTAATGSYFYTYQRIEGYNWADLGWGTANAKTVTLSFWVRSSVTGSHDGFIRDSTQAVDSTFSYSISSANTWEYKSATIAGATTGTYPATNGIGAALFINIANEVAVSGATFYITGVQLEAGSTGSSFAHEFVGDTLRKCQRYYAKITTGSATNSGLAIGLQVSTTAGVVNLQFPVSMRSAPTVSINNLIVSDNSTTDSAVTTLSSLLANPNTAYLNIGFVAMGAQFRPILLRTVTGGTTGFIDYSSEL